MTLFAEQEQIKRLRINVYNDSVAPISSAEYKGYALNGYAYCDVWQIPDKRDKSSGRWSYRYEGSFVPFAEVKQYQQNPKRPVGKDGRSHPAAKKLMRLYKQDNIELIDFETGEQQIFRVAGYSASRNQLDTCHNLESNAKQNYKSINVIFSNNQVRKLGRR